MNTMNNYEHPPHNKANAAGQLIPASVFPNVINPPHPLIALIREIYQIYEIEGGNDSNVYVLPNGLYGIKYLVSYGNKCDIIPL